jgi:hypothetical protein
MTERGALARLSMHRLSSLGLLLQFDNPSSHFSQNGSEEWLSQVR